MSRELINQAMDYLADFDSSGGTGDSSYCKLPNGVVIMWGAIVINNGSATADIDLPVTLKDLNFASVNLTPLAQDETWNVNYGSSTNSKINVGRLPTNSTRYAYWSVIGFWK